MVRAPFFDKNGVKKGAWSQEEDDKLRAYVQKYGNLNWRELPKFAGLSRCGKSCRLRWMNYLRPGLKHGSYSKEEYDLIFELHKQFGNKWSKIAAKLPGRTDNEIKNYWHTHLKKRTKEGASSSGLQKKLSSDVKLESSLAKNILSPTIFESFRFSPPSSSPTEFSHLTCDSASTSSNWIAEGSHALSETFEYYGGDFWTQPFLSEKDAHRLPLPQEGFVSSYFTNYYEDDAIDLFYQVTKELPGNVSQ